MLMKLSLKNHKHKQFLPVYVFSGFFLASVRVVVCGLVSNLSIYPLFFGFCGNDSCM